MRIRPRVLAWLMAAAALLHGASPALARELSGWSVHADDYPVNQGMQRFATSLASITRGAHTARVHPNAQLAPQGQVLEKIIAGEIDFAVTGLVGYGEKVPALQVLAMPYMFHDSAQMFELLDGTLGDLLAAELHRAGVVLLGWYDGGTRNFYHRSKALDRVREFKDMKLRVGTTRTHIEMVEALDAQAVPLPFKEVYQALEDGRIDGAENNLPSYESTGHYKLAPHYTFTRHLVSPEMLIMSRKTWDGFSRSEQLQLLQAGRQSALYMREEWNQRLKTIQARLQKEGVKFYECKDYGPMVRRMKPLYAPLWTTKDETSVQALRLILAGMTAPSSSQSTGAR